MDIVWRSLPNLAPLILTMPPDAWTAELRTNLTSLDNEVIVLVARFPPLSNVADPLLPVIRAAPSPCRFRPHASLLSSGQVVWRI